MVRQMLINDEFRGATKIAAEKWLADREGRIARKHRLIGLVFGGVGIVVTIVLFMLKSGA